MSTFTLQGRFYDGRQPIGLDATLIIVRGEVTLVCGDVCRSFGAGGLYVSPRIGRSDRFVTLPEGGPEGGQFQCADGPLLDQLPHESRSEGIVAWLEARLWVALACVGVIAALLLAAYFYGLPAMAEYAAPRISIESEKALGEEALAWLDEHDWFRPSAVGKEKQESIRAGFAGLCDGLPLEPHYRLKFRDSRFFGANAIALPGGTIVITDDMVNAARTEEEVLGILAHEIGHVELRHAMRHLLQDSAVAALASIVTADAASLSAAVAGLPALLAQTKYSREFEAQADDYAFELLKKRGLSSKGFADLMERLTEGAEDRERALAFISTHPVSAERVERARRRE